MWVSILKPELTTKHYEKHNRNRLSKGPVFTFSLPGKQFTTLSVMPLECLWACLLHSMSTTISLVSGYKHHPSVRHLPIHQDISLDQKIAFAHHPHLEKQSMEQVVYSFSFGLKCRPTVFLHFKAILFSAESSPKNIQKILESSNSRLYIAKRYRTAGHVAILFM